MLGSPAVDAAVIAAVTSLIVTLMSQLLGPFGARWLERHRSALQDAASARTARRDYEYDARKRLYKEVEPLLFQLFEASEHSYFRVKSLARTCRNGNLGKGPASWTAG